MRLVAVTVCWNYSDYLEQTIRYNRAQIDRWIVVTAPHDIATIELCERYAVECYISTRFNDDGRKFNKVKMQNDGIRRSFADWILLLDADIILPEGYKKYLSELELKQECIYSAPRVLCETKAELQLYEDGVTTPRIEKSGNIIGYFQLYNKRHTRRMPDESGYYAESGHNDVVFSKLWPVEKRKYLTKPVVHVGPICQNWFGRVTPAWA